jgi:hypothetical protein
MPIPNGRTGHRRSSWRARRGWRLASLGLGCPDNLRRVTASPPSVTVAAPLLLLSTVSSVPVCHMDPMRISPVPQSQAQFMPFASEPGTLVRRSRRFGMANPPVRGTPEKSHVGKTPGEEAQERVRSGCCSPRGSLYHIPVDHGHHLYCTAGWAEPFNRQSALGDECQRASSLG